MSSPPHQSLPDCFTTPIPINKGTSSSRRLALKRNTFCPTATGKMTARELCLTAPTKSKPKSGTTSTADACLFSSASNFSNQRVPAKVRAHAVSITPLVVAHRSPPCGKKVMIGNGWVLGHFLIGFLPVDNLHFGRALIVVKLPTPHTWKSLFELVKPCLAIFGRLRFAKELSRLVHLCSALLCDGHQGLLLPGARPPTHHRDLSQGSASAEYAPGCFRPQLEESP